jgi:beta-barrel assembly-enhancing protease
MRRSSSVWVRMALAAILGSVSLCSYYGKSVVNPITGEKQHVSISVPQEIALGQQSAPRMVSQYGGETSDPKIAGLVERVGQSVLEHSDANQSAYAFRFHVLRDPQTINAFALPGGQVFITVGLLKRLKTEGQLAGVLGHEIGHVIARHGAEHMAKAQLAQGLTGAAVIASYDPQNPSTRSRAQMAQLAEKMVTLKFGRDDELESDRLGVKFMTQAGYDPRAMLGVMKILAAAGGRRQAEFFSTHPNPENREAEIQKAIHQQFPDQVPADLKP